MHQVQEEPKVAKDTREKILHAAMDLMALYGYKGASVRKIAKAVGIRESAIYNHFKNKEEIFKTILASLFTTPLDDFFENHPPQTEATKGKSYLMEYAATIKELSFDARNEKLFRIIMLEIMQSDEVRKQFLKYFFDENIKKLSTAFFVMMQHSLIRSGDPILMAQEFFAPLFYYRLEITLFRMDEHPTHALSSVFEKHVDFFWEGIAL